MTINQKQDEIIADFSIYDDWMGKYEFLIDLGKDLPLIDSQYKVEENLIKGCQSQVRLHAAMKEDLLEFTADSDAVITKGNYRFDDSCAFGSQARGDCECRFVFCR